MDRRDVHLIGTVESITPLSTSDKGHDVLALMLVTTTGRRHEHQHVERHRVVCWDGLARDCSAYVSEGSRLMIDGALEMSRWTNAQGMARSCWQVVAREVRFLQGCALMVAGTAQSAD